MNILLVSICSENENYLSKSSLLLVPDQVFHEVLPCPCHKLNTLHLPCYSASKFRQSLLATLCVMQLY